MNQIRLVPKHVLAVLLGMVGLSAVLHVLSWVPVLTGEQSHPIGYFNMAMEGNLPTLFSTFLLGSCAALAFLIAVAECGDKRSFPYWLMLGLIFLALSIDETIMIHEYIGDRVYRRFQTSGAFRFAWVIPYIFLLVFLFVVFLKFYLRLPVATQLWTALAGFTYILGGMGLEMAGSARYAAVGKDRVYHMINSVEETLEMTGCVLFVYAFLSFLVQQHPDFRIEFSAGRKKAGAPADNPQD